MRRAAALLLAPLALVLAPAALAADGRTLYDQNCVWCHGDRLQGVARNDRHAGPGGEPAEGPPLRGVGELAADLYLSTGYMPIGNPREQPMRKETRFTPEEVRALVRFVGSHGGPKPPRVRPDRGDVAEGLKVFIESCAGCHQVVGEGGLATGARVPSLKRATATQIAEAVRVGPYLMPRYSERQISAQELDSLVAYVLYTRDPRDRGGWGLEHLGPLPEGIVAWLLAGAVLVAVARVIGEGLKR